MTAFEHRGIVEGFYGPPWSHEDRLWWIERLGAWGMNRYVYAPKDEPLHRARWREPYPEDDLRRFAELVDAGARHGVEVGFALSPGLSIRYAEREDRRALCAKFRTFRELGSGFLSLALDDVPFEPVHAEDRRAFPSLAAAQTELTHEVRAAIGDDCTLWLVPTDYLGVRTSEYLEELGATLAPEVEVGWTGRTVLSPTIEAGEARARAEVLRRPLLLWDNTPVADGPMRRMLHLGPYRGRSPAIAEHASGILLNPMQHARASAVTIRTAARFLEDPAGYEPERAFAEATRELGAGAADAFALFAEGHRFSPIEPDQRDLALEEGLAAARTAVHSGGDPKPALEDLRAAVGARVGVAAALRSGLSDRRLESEISAWIDAHARESRCMAAALDCVDTLVESASAKDRVFAFFGLESKLSREPIPAEASYGPRRVLYPQLDDLRDDTMALAPAEPTLIRDRCLSDEFVAFAEELALEKLATPERTAAKAAGAPRRQRPGPPR